MLAFRLQPAPVLVAAFNHFGKALTVGVRSAFVRNLTEILELLYYAGIQQEETTAM
jgi:hypothetical protein